MTAGQAVSAASALRYMAIFSPTAFSELVRVAGCPHVGAADIEAAVTAAHAGYSGADADTVTASAMTNPNTPKALVVAALEQPGGVTVRPSRLFAATHRHIAPDAEAWWDRLGHPDRTWLLSNEAVDPQFLEVRWELSPPAVAQNPAVGPVLLARLIAEGRVDWHCALRNPHISDELAWRGIEDCDPELRMRAYRNPRWARDELCEFRDAEQARDDSDQAAVRLLDALCGNRCAPGDAAVLELVHVPLRDDVAALTATLTATGAEAAQALVRGGFLGTVDELLEITTTFA